MSARKQGSTRSPYDKSSEAHTFVVKIMRPIFQTAVFYVNATSEENALLIPR